MATTIADMVAATGKDVLDYLDLSAEVPKITMAGAQGDVLVDQIAFMKRCGFDSFAPEAPLNQADVKAALSRYDHVYQGAADAAVPVWKHRHG